MRAREQEKQRQELQGGRETGGRERAAEEREDERQGRAGRDEEKGTLGGEDEGGRARARGRRRSIEGGEGRWAVMSSGRGGLVMMDGRWTTDDGGSWLEWEGGG